jgi:uncharacterized membrane protein
MNDMEKYLQKVSAGLYRLPESERSEILGEIRNHIHEAVSRQEPVQDVINRLGSPLRLAQSYISIHSVNTDELGLSNVWRDMAFFFSAGLASYIVVPTLFISALTFVTAAVGVVVFSILDFFIDIPIYDGIHLWGETVLIGFPAVAVSAILGLVCFFIAY